MKRSWPKLHSYRPKGGALAVPPTPRDPHEHMTPVQALALVAQEQPTEVLIVGYAADGHFFARSSAMSRQGALWLLEKGRQHVVGVLE